jgi:O-antigen ligase
LALFAVIMLSVSRVHQHFDFIAQLRPALLLVAITGFYAVANPKLLVRGSLLRTWPAKVVLGLAAAACLSTLFGLSIGRSGWYVIENYSKVIVVAFLLIAAIRCTRDLATFVWGYVIGCAGLAWLSLFVFDLSQTDGDSMYRLNDLYAFDANDVGCVMMIGLALTLLLFQTSRGRGRWAAGLIMVAIGATMAKTGSRGAFVGLVIVGGYLLFVLKHVSPVKRIAFVVVVTTALLISAPPGYWEQMKTLANPTQDYNWSSEDGRVQIAKRGMGYMLQRPLFGVGIYNFQLAEGTISEKARYHIPGTAILWSASHNSYVQVGAELGIPGLALWLTLVFGGILSMHRLRSRLPRQWARGDPEERFLYATAMYLPVALVGFAVTSFFVSFAYLDPIYIVAALMTGLYVSVEAKLKAYPEGGAVASHNGARRQARPRRLSAFRSR